MKNVYRLILAAFRVILTAALLILLSACAPATPPARDYWPTAGWRSDAPAKRGFDEAKLAGLKAEIEQNLPFLNSLLIVKDGYLVYEEYFNGYDASRLNPVHSVTKSFASALTGMAQAEGKIANLDVTLGTALPEYFANGQNADKKDITLRHMLMMRSGLDIDQDELTAEVAARS